MLELLCLSDGRAQCSLKSARSVAESTVHEANFEILYKNNNGEPGRGSVQVRARLFTIDSPSIIIKSWGLNVGVTAIRSSEAIVPRTLVFTFQNGGTLILDAASYEEVDGIKMCTFDLTKQNLNALEKSIQQVEIIDNRTHQRYISSESTGLYPSVLAEQARCLN